MEARYNRENQVGHLLLSSYGSGVGRMMRVVSKIDKGEDGGHGIGFAKHAPHVNGPYIHGK